MASAAQKRRARLKREKDVEGFKLFLQQSGAEVLAPTNPYEVVRYRANGETSVIYKKDNGQRTYTGGSRKAFDAFVNGDTSIRLGKRGQRLPGGKKYNAPLDRAIEERDGCGCFYCGDPFDEGEHRRTREHLVPVTAGGPSHISNLFHAGHSCNLKAGAMSAPEKIRLREKMHAEKRRRIEDAADAFSLGWFVPELADSQNTR